MAQSYPAQDSVKGLWQRGFLPIMLIICLGCWDDGEDPIPAPDDPTQEDPTLSPPSWIIGTWKDEFQIIGWTI